MKKLLALAFCLSALLSICPTFTKEEPTSQTEVVSTLGKKDDKPDVRNGDPCEGICLL